MAQKATALSRQDALAALTGLTDALAERFTGRAGADRLVQIRFHLDTAGMAIGHLYEEDDRRAEEKAERIRRVEAGEGE